MLTNTIPEQIAEFSPPLQDLGTCLRQMKPGEVKIMCYLRLIGVFPSDCIISARTFQRRRTLDLPHLKAPEWRHFGFKPNESGESISVNKLVSQAGNNKSGKKLNCQIMIR